MNSAPQENSVLNSVRRGALAGLAAGLAYGAVELVLTAAVPWLRASGWELLPWQWSLVGMLFAVYAVVGMLGGAAGAALLTFRGRTLTWAQAKCIACLILSLAFTVNLARAWPLARSEYAAMALSVGLVAAFSASLRSAAWERRMSFLAAPAILSIWLLIGPWVSRETLLASSVLVKTALSLAAMAAVLGFAAIRRRLMLSARKQRKWAVATAAAILGLLWLHHPAGTTAAPSIGASALSRPNIVLIVMDTVRADHLSVYGYDRPTTPFLQAFARESTLYERAIATEDFTTPTHASMFTGLYSSWHGAMVRPDYPYGAPLPPRTRTLASALRAHGYWTAAIAANYARLGRSSGLTQGFEYEESREAVHLSDPLRPFYLREGARKLLSLVTDTSPFDQYCLRAQDINSAALGMLEQARGRNRPFFLFLNYMDAHPPYLPPAAYLNRFLNGEKTFNPVSAQGFAAVRDGVNSGKRVLGAGEKRYLTAHYDGGIAYLDFEIGKLLARLRELGLYDHTLVVITADHGEAFGEHGRMSHGVGSIYEDQIHIPLLIKNPDQHEARRSRALVSQVDFMPTFLDWAGIEAPRGLQGYSLLRPPDPALAAVFAEGVCIRDWQENPGLRGTRLAVHSGDWKLITWTAGKPELYNVAEDPGELHNLYRPEDSVSAALQVRLSAWASTMPRRAAPQAVKPIDPAVLNKLRSLGYAK